MGTPLSTLPFLIFGIYFSICALLLDAKKIHGIEFPTSNFPENLSQEPLPRLPSPPSPESPLLSPPSIPGIPLLQSSPPPRSPSLNPPPPPESPLLKSPPPLESPQLQTPPPPVSFLLESPPPPETPTTPSPPPPESPTPPSPTSPELAPPPSTPPPESPSSTSSLPPQPLPTPSTRPPESPPYHPANSPQEQNEGDEAKAPAQSSNGSHRGHRSIQPPRPSSATVEMHSGQNKVKLNSGKKVGLVFVGFAGVLQIAVAGFLGLKRRELLVDIRNP